MWHSRRPIRQMIVAKGLVALLGLSLVFAADARPRDGWGGEPEFGGNEYADVPQLSLDDAVGIAQSAINGEVIAASPSSRGGRLGYRIRLLLPGGRVRTVWIDAETGRMSDAG